MKNSSETKKSKLVKLIEKKIPDILVEYYGNELATGVLLDTGKRFEHLLYEIPYIGGKHNRLTATLNFTGWCLAFYRAMQSEKKSVNETGKIIYEAVESVLNQYPKAILKIMGKFKFTKLFLNKRKKSFVTMQEKKYSEDWMGTFIEGEKDMFDYGFDYTECGICKLLKTQKAEELIPYICVLDFVESKALGLGLVRSKTIERGDDICDFRFKQGRETLQGWEIEIENNMKQIS